MKILLGTKNGGKIKEIKALRALHAFRSVELLTYKDYPFKDVAEEGRSFKANALKKAREICKETGMPVLAEDSGLEVAALGGKPGALSSRFAGEDATDEENMEKLLSLLANIEDRRARFRCAAVLCFPNGKEISAEGELKGKIVKEPKGSSGFGYDPVFVPEDYQETLAQLGPEVKNAISHRRKALIKLWDRPVETLERCNVTMF